MLSIADYPISTVLSEPLLEFGHGQRMVDPHDGLSMFGPFDLAHPGRPRAISYGLIGTDDLIASFGRFAVALNRGILSPSDRDHLLWPTFPGFTAAFAAEFPLKPTQQRIVDKEELEKALKRRDVYQRVSEVVDIYLREIATMAHREERLDLIVCTIPDAVFTYCRPRSRVHVEGGAGDAPAANLIASRRAGQLELFENVNPMIYQSAPDFRRQLKARSMTFGVAVQIIRGSTLDTDERASWGGRGVTPLSDRAWNLGVAAYYKAGGKPWRLDTAREGVCYVGIAFRRTESKSSSKSASCAAQMFLDSGDGVVFRGEFGPWYSPERRQFRLSRRAAGELLRGVLETYHALEGKPLKEIFVHSRSDIGPDEYAGFEDVCPPDARLVCVRVRTERFGVRLFRKGRYPVLRGTSVQFEERAGYLWASGFKPRIRTYDGAEVPLPLKIDVQHGEAPWPQVARDILGLTKLNYNACRLGDSSPVTIGFSDAVGEILVSNPHTPSPDPRFKFYI